jgi:hypothetical protein
MWQVFGQSRKNCPARARFSVRTAKVRRVLRKSRPSAGPRRRLRERVDVPEANAASTRKNKIRLLSVALQTLALVDPHPLKSTRAC